MNIESQAHAAAAAFRTEHRLGQQPLGDLAELIEQTTGHDVAVLDAADGEHGMTMRDPARGAIFIGVARSANPMRQRSTLAHELGHVIFGDWERDGGFADRSPEEIRADAFARHLLIPAEGVREFLGHRDTTSDAELSTAVQRFLVSPAMAAIALRDAGYASPEQASEWMKIHTPQLATRYGWSDHYAALQLDANRLRAPQGLLARAITGYAEGIVSAQAVATLRSLPVDQVRRELEEASIVPATLDSTGLMSLECWK